VVAVLIAEQIAAASIHLSFSVIEVSVFCDCCISICDLVLVSTNKLQRQLRGGFEV
jgi:hypothetical protein